MNTLSIHKLVVWGRHGKTGDEPHISQPFEVSITVYLDFTRVVESDSLSDTIDYKDLEQIAREAIAGGSLVLLETLAGKIATEILKKPAVLEVRVKITKLRPKTEAIPSCVVTKKRSSVYTSECIHNIDWPHVVSELDKYGGVSVRLLTEEFREQLLAEAKTYEYEKQPEIVGPHKVHEQLSSVTTPFLPGSLLFRLKEELERMIIGKMKSSSEEYLFTIPLRFNEISLQRYEAGSIGITPHMDGRSVVNIICVIVLTGESKFALCEDREGSNPKFLDATPGNIIFMRSSGYRGSAYRPFHFVSDIPKDRIVVGIRQNSGDAYLWRKENKTKN